MRAIYGARFQATYGDAPNTVWLDAIDELSDEECRAGFEKLRKGDGWPPSLPDFMAACRPRAGGVRYLGVPLEGEARRALMLPKPAVNLSLAERVLASCRRSLGVSGKAPAADPTCTSTGREP